MSGSELGPSVSLSCEINKQPDQMDVVLTDLVRSCEQLLGKGRCWRYTSPGPHAQCESDIGGAKGLLSW